jgi:hypothetical protein
MSIKGFENSFEDFEPEKDGSPVLVFMENRGLLHENNSIQREP